MNNIEQNKYGMWVYDNNPKFSDETIKERNDKWTNESKQHWDKILSRGDYIEYPLFTSDNNGNYIEKHALIHRDFMPSIGENFDARINYNIYIPSYGRAKDTLTPQVLRRFGIDNFYMCIDPDQFDSYIEYYEPNQIIIRDIGYKTPNMTETCSSAKCPNDMLGHSGLCNFIHDLAKSLGEKRYWTMDDDIRGFNLKAYAKDTVFPPNAKYIKEDFYRCSNLSLKYNFDLAELLSDIEVLASKTRNSGFIGFEKSGLVFTQPISWKIGTRVYTCYLSTTDTQVKHIGRQNNDVITSIELNKVGYPNMLLEGYYYDSLPTQFGSGGQVDMYSKFGTLDKGQVLCQAEPNYSKINYNYNRIHHYVDYNRYNKQRVVGATIPTS